MHEILIAILILIIVAVQIKITLETSKKINRFKMIIPSAVNFETVKVYIPESRIKDISVDDILANLKKFSLPYDQNLHEILEENENEMQSFDEHHEEGDEISEIPIATNFQEDYSTLIWIGKGSEEKRIEFRLLKSFEFLGWNRID